MNSLCCHLPPSSLSLCRLLPLCLKSYLHLSYLPPFPWPPPPVQPLVLPPLRSPSIPLTWHRSPSCAGLWTPASLPTLSFIRTLKSRNHSLLSSAGRCHLLRHPSHLADDQYEPSHLPPHCISFSSGSLWENWTCQPFKEPGKVLWIHSYWSYVNRNFICIHQKHFTLIIHSNKTADFIDYLFTTAPFKQCDTSGSKSRDIESKIEQIGRFSIYIGHICF